MSIKQDYIEVENIYNKDGEQTISLTGDQGIVVSGDINVGGFTDSGTSTLNLRAGGEHDTKLGLFESSENYGFSLNYDGGDNKLYLKRHDNSSGGSAVLTFQRYDNNAAFAGDVTVGSNKLTAGSLDINGNADISGNLTGVDNLTINGTLTGVSTATFAGDVQLLTSSGEYALYGAANAQTQLYHNGIKKFETTSVGIDVTGKVQGDSLDLDPSANSDVSIHMHANSGALGDAYAWNLIAESSADNYEFTIAQGTTDVLKFNNTAAAGNNNATFAGQVDAKTLTIDGSSLGSYHDFQSKPIDSDSGLFTVGGHGETGGYSRAVSIFTSHDGVWNSWVGTNLRWDGTNFKRASDAGNNNWGNIAGIRFLGNSTASGAAMQFIIDPPDQSSNPSGEQTIGTSLPSSMTALSINNDLSATFAGDISVGDDLTVTDDATVGGNFTSAGYVQSHGILYIRNSIQVVNKADNAWLNLAVRDTSGSEVVYNLANLGTATFAGSISVGGHAVNDILVAGDTFANDDSHLMTAAAIEDKILSYGYGTGSGSGSGDVTLAGAQTFTGAKTFGAATQFNNTVTVGADDTGHDVFFYGATSGKYLKWDESADCLFFPDDTSVKFGNGNDARIYISSDNLHIQQDTADTDIKFLADNGSGQATAYMTLDGSDKIVRVHVPLWIGDYITHIGDTNTFFGFSGADTFVVHAGASGHAELTIDSTSATFAGTVETGGDLTVGGTGGIFIPEYIYHTGDTNTYLGFPSNNDTIVFATNGSTALTLDASNVATFAGNVTLNGDGKLLKFTPTSYDDVELGIDSNGFVIYNTTDSRYDLKISGTGNATFGGDVTATANYTAGNSKIIYKAQRSGGAVAGDWSYDDATTDMSLGTSTAHSFSLKTGNTRALTINSSQNATFAGSITMPEALKATNSNLKFYAGGTHVFNVDVNKNIYPQTHNSTDLGFSSTLAFRQLWLSGDINTSGELIINNNATNNDNGIHIKNDTDAYGGGITFWTEYGGTDTNIARVQGGTNGSNGILYLQTANTSKVLTTALSLDYNQDAFFKGSVSIQSDNDNRFLVRSNDYTISRIISRGNTGTNLDKGLFSLMSSDGTNNNIEQVRIDSAGNSWFNGGNVGIGIVSPSGLLHLHKSGSGTDNTIITEDDARRIYIGRDSIKATDLSNNAALLHIQQNDGDARFGGGITVDGDVLVSKDSPLLTLKNTTNEHTDGGAESKIVFKDHADNSLGKIEVSHNGTNDNALGNMYLQTSNGSTIVTALELNSSQNATFAGHIYLPGSKYIYSNNKGLIGATASQTEIYGIGNIISFYAEGGGTKYMTVNGGNVAIGTNNPTSLSSNTTSLSIDSTRTDLSGAVFFKANGTVQSQIYWGTSGLILENTADDADIMFKSDDGSGGTTTYFFLDGSQANINFQKDVIFADSKKALFGGSGDLQIYHDGSNSYIDDSGTGELRIRGSATAITSANGSQYLAYFAGTGAQEVSLYAGNAVKFKTVAAGTKTTFAATSSTDGDAAGDIVYFSETSTTAGRIYYYTSAGAWELADADAQSSASGMLAVALGSSSSTHGMLLRGMVTLNHDPGAVGDTLFLSTAIGQATATAPSGAGDIVRVIGYCLHASTGQIYFNPDGAFVEVTAG